MYPTRHFFRELSTYCLVAASPAPLGSRRPVMLAPCIKMVLYTFILEGGLPSIDLTISKAVSLFILKRNPSVDSDVIGWFNRPTILLVILPNNNWNCLF